MSHPIDHATGIVPMLCDALAGLAPRGFANAELVFEARGDRFELAHAAYLAPEPRERWTVLDTAACTAIANALAADLAADLPDWDRRVSLERAAAEWVLTIGGRTARVEIAVVDRRLFTDAVLARVTAGAAEVAERRRAFDVRFGEPDETWILEAPSAGITTPRGELRAQVIAAYAEPHLHWGDATSLPAPFSHAIRELRVSSRDPMYEPPSWIVLEPALIMPIAERALLDLDLHRVIEWPVDAMTLYLGVAPSQQQP